MLFSGSASFLYAGIVLSCLLLAGCQSGREPGSYSHASARIDDKSLGEIQQICEAVFQEDGYRLNGKHVDLMIFDRLGSRRDAIKWGGLLGGGVVMRVKVGFREMGANSYLLQADAYAVRNTSDSFFEEDSRNIILNRRPYQKLLDEVKKRLKK